MGKVMWTFQYRKTQWYEAMRDLNKIIHYANQKTFKIKKR